MSLARRERFEDAEREFGRALAIVPAFASATYYRAETLRKLGRSDEAAAAYAAYLDLVPDDASVTATYGILPHLSHREQIYDWPNPWVMAYFGNDDGYRLPDPSAIEYLVIDRRNVGEGHRELLASLVAPGGEFDVLFDESDILVARRRPG